MPVKDYKTYEYKYTYNTFNLINGFYNFLVHRKQVWNFVKLDSAPLCSEVCTRSPELKKSTTTDDVLCDMDDLLAQS